MATKGTRQGPQPKKSTSGGIHKTKTGAPKARTVDPRERRAGIAQRMKGRTIPGGDRETDVLIVGFGEAGANAAIAAHDAGARVLIIEKMGVPGGDSGRKEPS